MKLRRVLRFTGVLIACFLLPLVAAGQVPIWLAMGVQTIAVTVSNLCYYELGLLDEEL